MQISVSCDTQVGGEPPDLVVLPPVVEVITVVVVVVVVPVAVVVAVVPLPATTFTSAQFRNSSPQPQRVQPPPGQTTALNQSDGL